MTQEPIVSQEPSVQKSVLHKGNLIITRSFTPEASLHIGYAEIVISNGLKTISLNELMRPGWRIYEDESEGGQWPHCDPTRREILIPFQRYNWVTNENGQQTRKKVDFLTTRGGLLQLFHEIGHVNEDEGLTTEESEEFAWNFADSKRKELKKDGLDIEPDMTEEDV